MGTEPPPYVSRGGLKLEAALRAFVVDPAGLIAADLGCSTGGFTDCLLHHGAAHVYAVDTAYGELAWKLRQDARISVHERTNALHFDPWEKVEGFAGCDLVTVDLGWTRQSRALPAARCWLRPGGEGRIVSLLKPHYEAGAAVMRGRKRYQLQPEEVEQVTAETLSMLPEMGFELLGSVRAPIEGRKGGNTEWLICLRPADCPGQH